MIIVIILIKINMIYSKIAEAYVRKISFNLKWERIKIRLTNSFLKEKILLLRNDR